MYDIATKKEMQITWGLLSKLAANKFCSFIAFYVQQLCVLVKRGRGRSIKRIVEAVGIVSVVILVILYLSIGSTQNDCDWYTIWNKHGAMEDISKKSCDKFDMVKESGYKSYPSYEKYLQYFNQSMLSHLEFQDDYKVLEFGCGSGSFANVALDVTKGTTLEYVGFDISKNLVDIANHCVGKRGKFYAGELDNRFTENSFDVILAPGVFKYIDLETAEPIIDALYKLLKPGGEIFIGQMPQMKFKDQYLNAKDGGQTKYHHLSKCTPPHVFYEPEYFTTKFESKFPTIEFFYDRDNVDVRDQKYWYAIPYNFAVYLKKKNN